VILPKSLSAPEIFWREGYYILDLGVDVKQLDEVIESLRGRYYDGGGKVDKATGAAHYPHRVQDAWRFSESVRRLANLPLILTTLKAFYARDPFCFQTLNFHKGSRQAVHSDAMHFNSLPKSYMCGVWIALEDVTADCGPLVIYPGSHRLPELTYESLNLTIGDYGKYEAAVKSLTERLTPKMPLLKKGQALIWAANLLHGGSPIKDPASTRHSQVNHYYFTGCQHYVPLLSMHKALYPKPIRAVTSR
jgi:ectoine hydroxylase-related dioxygenase (phytanoyl-CoA dioxygenase family)